VLLIAILIVLSLLFGGFHKGTKAGSLPHFCTSPTSSTSCTPAPPPRGEPN